MTQDTQVRAAAVCNEPDCKSEYPESVDVVIALWCGGEGVRRPLNKAPLKDGEFLLCQNCGTQYEVKAEWLRSIESGAPAEVLWVV